MGSCIYISLSDSNVYLDISRMLNSRDKENLSYKHGDALVLDQENSSAINPEKNKVNVDKLNN